MVLDRLVLQTDRVYRSDRLEKRRSLALDIERRHIDVFIIHVRGLLCCPNSVHTSVLPSMAPLYTAAAVMARDAKAGKGKRGQGLVENLRPAARSNSLEKHSIVKDFTAS